MATSGGVGRGRGWLNLNKTSSPNSTPISITTMNPEQKASESSSHIEQQKINIIQYRTLIDEIKHLDRADDGILLNQKLNHIFHVWYSICHNPSDLKNSVCALYYVCYFEPELVPKLLTLFTSNSFYKKVMYEQRLYFELVKILQENFESRDAIRANSASDFRISARILCDHFSTRKNEDGARTRCFIKPCLTYLQMLLETVDPLNYQLFTRQLYVHGEFYRTTKPEDLSNLMNNVREILVSDKILCKTSKAWLLLALEIANNRFAVLPADTTDFYTNLLGETAMVELQPILDTLFVSTPELDYAKVKQLNIQHYVNQQAKTVQCGRPILGAGAKNATTKNDVVKNDSLLIVEKSTPLNKVKELSIANNTNSSMSSSSSVSKKIPAKNRAWEHDDRFETDYS